MVLGRSVGLLPAEGNISDFGRFIGVRLDMDSSFKRPAIRNGSGFASSPGQKQQRPNFHSEDCHSGCSDLGYVFYGFFFDTPPDYRTFSWLFCPGSKPGPRERVTKSPFIIG